MEPEALVYQRIFSFAACVGGVALAPMGWPLLMAVGACMMLIETP